MSLQSALPPACWATWRYPIASGVLALESDDELALAAAPGHVDRAPDSLEKRDDAWVVPTDGRDETSDAGRAGVGGELARERGSHAAALVRVGHPEGDLGGDAAPDEPRDPDRLRISVDVSDEDVMVLIDARKPCSARGVARSKLATLMSGKGLGVPATARNWTTVTKLLALVDE